MLEQMRAGKGELVSRVVSSQAPSAGEKAEGPDKPQME